MARMPSAVSATSAMAAMSRWSPRRWVIAALAGAGTGLAIALVTAMVGNPVFARSVPTPWWAWPTLAVSAVLSGLLLATYVREPGAEPSERVSRPGGIGGLLTVFAVGCPVCNKLALLALGSAGAMQWFAPVQPFLGVAAIGLLAWGLTARLRGELACPVRTEPVPTEPTRS